MTVQAFRKKPVEIQAMQYCDCNPDPVIEWSGARFIDVSTGQLYDNDPNKKLYQRVLAIHTLEGDMVISPGDWVIRGVQGEFYPCKPDIFTATYDAADA